MKDIYAFHYALNCLYLEGDKAIFYEDAVRTFDDAQRELFNDFLKNFWQNIIGIKNPLFITPSNQGDVAKQIRKEGVSNLKPFSVYESYNSIESLLNLFNARLYGSQAESKEIFETILSFKSKVRAYNLCSKVGISFLLEDVAIVELKGLESAIEKLLKNGKAVVKGEYGQMGMNSQIISSNKEMANFLNRCGSPSFVATQEITKPGMFIVEPFFEHMLAPSVCFYITDDNIFLKYMHDRKVNNLEYVESSSPSESPSIKRILDYSLRYSQMLQSKGYRGPVDFEFMEDSKGDIKFCEINARYPISYYPSEFPIDKKPYRLKKFRLRNPNLSFRLLNRIIGDYWFNPDKKIGIIPLNIPYFSEPKQRFALLFVGNNKAQTEEMYQVASILESSK